MVTEVRSIMWPAMIPPIGTVPPKPMIQSAITRPGCRRRDRRQRRRRMGRDGNDAAQILIGSGWQRTPSRGRAPRELQQLEILRRAQLPHRFGGAQDVREQPGRLANASELGKPAGDREVVSAEQRRAVAKRCGRIGRVAAQREPRQDWKRFAKNRVDPIESTPAPASRGCRSRPAVARHRADP